MDRIMAYGQGGSPSGPEFTYAGRPDASYRKGSDGAWWIKSNSTGGKYVPIQDPTGKRTAILNKGAVQKTSSKPTQTLVAGVNALGSQVAKVAQTQMQKSNSILTEEAYLEQLKKMENGIQKGYANGKWTPHASVEGGSPTIAYGHKLKPGEDYSAGITDEQAHKLLMQDYSKKKASAQAIVDRKYGAGTFAGLDSTKQLILTDYEYNTGLSKFPSFMDGVVKNDQKKMLAEYKRYTGSQELTKRNEWTRNIIQTMKQGGLLLLPERGFLLYKTGGRIY